MTSIVIVALAAFFVTVTVEVVTVEMIRRYGRAAKKNLNPSPSGLSTILAIAILYVADIRHIPAPLTTSLIVATTLMFSLARIDLYTGFLPNPLLVALFVWALIHRVFIAPLPLTDVLIGLLPGLLLLLAHWWKPKGMGLGDVKLAFALGLLQGGMASLEAFILGAVMAALWALLAVRNGRLAWTDTFPYGPFLIAGYWIVLTLIILGPLG